MMDSRKVSESPARKQVSLVVWEKAILMNMPMSRRWIFAVVFALAPGPALARPVDGFTYVAKRGDKLINIGKQFLAQPANWTKLVKPNRIADPDRIQPGREIRIPFALLRSEPAPAVVAQSIGDVRAQGNEPVIAGDRLTEGGSLRTGRDGYVTLRFVDGSTMTVQRQSELTAERLRSVAGTDIVLSGVRLDSGRVEAAARSRSQGSSRFEVRSRLASAAVRGTDFRVSVSGERRTMIAEVLTGTVALAGLSQANDPGALIAAGQGSVVEEGRAARTPVPLLSAPDLSGFATLQERPLVRLRFPAIAGASTYRVQVARDAAFQLILREDQLGTPDFRLLDLEDADYHVRVRAADSLGIEGRDATAAFRLKARPEPPFPSAPVPNGKIRGAEARLEWTANPDAYSYRLQIAEDAAFARIVRAEAGVREPGYVLSGVKFSEYFWRLGSTRESADHGPWSEAQRFSLLPPPANPEPAIEEADAFVFRWGGEPGQRFSVEISGSAVFDKLALRLDTTEPMARVPRPQPGIYFLRLRATDPDGFVGPYTRPQRFEVRAVGGLLDSSGRPVSSADGRPVGTQLP